MRRLSPVRENNRYGYVEIQQFVAQEQAVPASGGCKPSEETTGPVRVGSLQSNDAMDVTLPID